jgi:hypothetical protein
MNKSIWPNVNSSVIVNFDNSMTFIIQTHLRKNHCGKWYLIFFEVKREIQIFDSARSPITSLWQQLIHNVYLFQVMGRIDSNTATLDEDQRTEMERMIWDDKVLYDHLLKKD